MARTFPVCYAALFVVLIQLDISCTNGLPPFNFNVTEPSASTVTAKPVTLPVLDRYILNLNFTATAYTRGILSWEIPTELEKLFRENRVYFTVRCSRLDTSGDVPVKPLGNTSRLLTPLEPGVPYSCIVFFETNIDTPVNDDEEIIFFSKELAPTHYASISNFKSARLNSNTVRMMWAPASLGDSRGVPHYRLRIREGNFRSLSRKLGLQGALNSLPLLRSIDMRTSTSVNVSRLVDSKTYTVQVAVYTTGGQGIYTYPQVVHCVQCPSDPKEPSSSNGLVVAAVLCLLAMMIMVIIAVILLIVIVKAYQKKRRYAHAASEQDPIIVREERGGDEYTDIN
jgi:hypothetical protein